MSRDGERDIVWVVREGDGVTVGEIVTRAKVEILAIAEGRVFLGRNRISRADDSVKVGDEIRIFHASKAISRDVTMLARGDGWIAVEKPAGIPTIPDHRGAESSLLAAVAREVGASHERVHPTSRLDRGVSGVVLFALDASARDALKRARDEGNYERHYIAIADHAPDPSRGEWNARIGRAKNPRLRAVDGRDPESAHTTYATIGAASSRALLALAPRTGRTHQLRVHASHAGVPLLGDREYQGVTRLTLASGKSVTINRIMLHAARIVVRPPQGEEIRVSAPVPAELREMWTSLGGDAELWNTAIACDLSGP